MPNFTPPVGYPYGPEAPLPSPDANKIAENGLKAPNADEGSAHAPTADLEWSGAGGGGFSFDTLAPFPFYGHLDVTGNLRFTAPVGGSVRLDSTVALDIFGPATIKTGVLVNVDTGASMIFLAGATITVAAGATCNLSGDTIVRGTLTIESSGGPGALVIEAGTTCTHAGSELYQPTHSETWQEGAEINGVVTRKGLEKLDGASARKAYRAVVNLANADADVTVAADRYNVPLTITANRVYTARYTGTVPRIGERIKFTRAGTTAPSAVFTASIVSESGVILFKWGSLRCGDCEIEFNGADWEFVGGHSVAVGTSGIYDDVWV